MLSDLHTSRPLGAYNVGTCTVALILVALTGCASPEAPGGSVEGVSSFDEQLYWAERDDAVSEAQLAALRAAAESDAMSYEEISALLEDQFRCFEAAGISYQRLPDEEDPPGFLMPWYSHGEPLETADACHRETIQYAWIAYQGQPRAVELAEADLRERRPEIMECLRGRGIVVDDDATFDEMWQLDAQWRERNDYMDRGCLEGTPPVGDGG